MAGISSRLALGLALSVTGALLAAPGGFAAPPQEKGPQEKGQQNLPLERQVLPRDDGFASLNGGTTGGAAAVPERVYDVGTRAELQAALAAAGAEPKIIRVHGEVLGNADAAGNPLTCEDYAEGTGYTLEAYLAAYDPAVWGWGSEPEGELETARLKAAAQQKATMLTPVPSNTTIVGATPQATLRGLSLQINGSANVIIRNLNHAEVSDCFPQWDPTDGAQGNWNSEYDMVQIINRAENIWVDHNYYTDAPGFDDLAPEYFGRPYQQHDGSVDITNGSDLVTVSHNRFENRDKLMLIGSTDSPNRGDAGRLRVTLHHNEFVNIGQRTPRVRYGQVDVYNNHFSVTASARVPYVYSLGAGFESHLWAEANAFTLPADVDPSLIIGHYKGTRITTKANTLNGHKIDLRAKYNAAAPAEKQLAEDVSWQPVARTKVSPAQAIPALLKKNTGPVFTASRPTK